MSATESHPLDETGQVDFPDYDNLPTTNLYTLEDVQAYEAEVRRAAVEGRQPTLTDPTKRLHTTELIASVDAELPFDEKEPDVEAPADNDSDNAEEE
jgi:hypothetical protein